MPPRVDRKQMKRPSDRPQAAAASDIYDSLVAEATSATDFSSHDERPLKRRKAGPQPRSKAIELPVRSPEAPSSSRQMSAVRSPTRTEIEDMGHDSASDSGFDFEDVPIEADSPIELSSDDEIGDVSISLGQQSLPPGSSSSVRRKVASKADRRLRIEGHKAHFVALMGHCMIANNRCNDRTAQRSLQTLLTKTAREYLTPNKEHTAFQQNRTFLMGLQRAVDAFKGAFEVTASGVRRAFWPNDGHESAPVEQADVADRKEFIEAAKTLTGSQDTGNQLFCAMLRGAKVNARLVCSFQVLPLSNTTAAPATPSKPLKPRVFAIAPDYPLDQSSPVSSLKDKAIASASSRIGRPEFHPEKTIALPLKRKRINKLRYPVFWIEVLNPSCKKWTPVDPVVTHSVEKAARIEPPASYDQNQLVYAIAFSKDGSAKDVTIRYAKQYNAKTRRTRLESLGETETAWLSRIMRMFAAPRRSTADAQEELELADRLRREAMPANIQDFKGHPMFALERHLRRHEVIHPRQESGKVNAGTAANPKMEPVFKRALVRTCRSAEQWYRQGRIVKPGEQAVKMVPARFKRKGSDDEGDEPDTTALYTIGQTELYIPKPVVRDKVPRNGFGNLDVYVPSMVPAGAVHVRHSLAKQAAEILSIDAVDAVTGFKFTGRKGTTVIEGVIIPERYETAVKDVVDGLIWQELDERSRSRSALALRQWKHFLRGLRIAERVASYATEPVEHQSRDDVETSSAWFADEDVELHTAGQYTLDELVKTTKTAKTRPKRRRADSDDDDQVMHDADESKGEEDSDERSLNRQHSDLDEVLPYAHDENDNHGGGFVVEDDDLDNDSGGEFMGEHEVPSNDSGGGFVIEHDSAQESHFMAVDDIDSKGRHGGFLQDNENEIVTSPKQQRYDTGTTRTAAIDLTLDTPERDMISPNRREHEQPTPSIWRQPQYQENQISDDALSHKSGRSTSAVAHDDDESMKSRDPDDDDAEPDWLESE